MKKIVLILLLLSSINSLVFSQLSDIDQFIQVGKDDIGKIAKPYVAPLLQAYGASLSNGWYNTARPHDLLGFDLNISVSTALIPLEKQTYDLAELELGENLPLGFEIALDPENTIAPTVVGVNTTDRPRIIYRTTGGQTVYTLASFEHPDGTGMTVAPMPTIKAAFGIGAGTEIMTRFCPNIQIGDNAGGFSTWGIGIKHGLTQWLSDRSSLRAVNMSLMAAYSSLSASVALDFQPEDYGDVINYAQAIDFSGQKMEYGITNLTANFLISYDQEVYTIYGGFGISKSSAFVKMLGNYPLAIPSTDGQIIISAHEEINHVTDPVDIEIENGASSISPRGNLGFRLRFIYFTFNLEVTYAEYIMATGGIGFSFDTAKKTYGRKRRW